MTSPGLKEALKRGDYDRLASFIRHANWFRATTFAARWLASYHQTLVPERTKWNITTTE